jgi:hypothetical protein
MPLSDEDREQLTKILLLIWTDAWSRYRALLAVLESKGLGPAERLEADAEAWIRAHAVDLQREAVAKYAAHLGPIDENEEGPRG